MGGRGRHHFAVSSIPGSDGGVARQFGIGPGVFRGNQFVIAVGGRGGRRVCGGAKRSVVWGGDRSRFIGGRIGAGVVGVVLGCVALRGAGVEQSNRRVGSGQQRGGPCLGGGSRRKGFGDRHRRDDDGDGAGTG